MPQTSAAYFSIDGMISAARIKFIKSLSEKKFRDREGLFTVEGEKMVSEAMASSFEVTEVFRKEDIGENAMGRISSLSSPSPVLATVRIPGNLSCPVEEALPEGPGLYLALDSIRDPGNMGTILRIADWFGIDGVFATPDSVDLFNPKVVQSTMGAIFRVKFHYVPVTSLLERVSSLGGVSYGTFLEGKDIYTTSLSTGELSPTVIVIGNESRGISHEVGKLISSRITIPSFARKGEGSESLNAAVATAVTVSEFRRRTHSAH